MSQPYCHHPVYHLVPRQALEGLRGRPAEEGARAIRPARLLLVLLVRLVVGLVWLLRGLEQLLVFLNRYGNPAAGSDHR
jgi:hypothetical protein